MRFERIGRYNVTSLLGEGGMGQVWQATDTQLHRDVALKILPDAFADDPDRLARFEREAHVLASLNHPNIAQIHGIEQSDDTRALVLELVEGPTLADRIAKGPIPVDEALPIAEQIAEALEAAHEQGIIHRDLKPANVKVKADGTVKVLDFGLAKALDTAPKGDPSQSPTLTAAATQMGVIMGTAAYMPPEMARGKTVDKRADVWAFGAVLFEMLTGKKPFVGDDVSDTLALVLKFDPEWDALPTDAPPRIRQLIQTCLQKDLKQRVHDVADVRLAMEGAFESQPAARNAGSAGDSTSVRLMNSSAVAVGVVALVVGVLMGRAWFRSPDSGSAQGLTRLSLNVYPGQHLSGGLAMEEMDWARQRPSRTSFVLSPNGHYLVYVASDGETTQLYRRPLDQAQATPIPGTEGASSPFFAPDGNSVGFVVALPSADGASMDTQLKRLSLESEEVRTIATSGAVPATDHRVEEFVPLGAQWTANDTILLSPGDAIYEVPANGGRLSRLTTLEAKAGVRLMYPQLLPGGRAVLFNLAAGGVPSEWDIVVESLDTGQRSVVVEGGSDPRYLLTGHILFVRSGTSWPFHSM